MHVNTVRYNITNWNLASELRWSPDCSFKFIFDDAPCLPAESVNYHAWQAKLKSCNYKPVCRLYFHGIRRPSSLRSHQEKLCSALSYCSLCYGCDITERGSWWCETENDGHQVKIHRLCKWSCSLNKETFIVHQIKRFSLTLDVVILNPPPSLTCVSQLHVSDYWCNSLFQQLVISGLGVSLSSSRSVLLQHRVVSGFTQVSGQRTNRMCQFEWIHDLCWWQSNNTLILRMTKTLPVLSLVHLPGSTLQVVYLLTSLQSDVLQLVSQLGLVLGLIVISAIERRWT